MQIHRAVFLLFLPVLFFVISANAAPGIVSDADTNDALPKDFFKPGETLHSHATGNFTVHARFQALNKVTAHTSTIELEKGQEIRFGTLTIGLESCWKAAPEEMPESAALLKITEQKTGEEKRPIFFGWMFASSPSVNALEHSVYDVVVLECY